MNDNFISLVECIASGQHLADCDEDGYCNLCGEQEGLADNNTKHTPGPWFVSKPQGAFSCEVMYHTGEKLAGVKLSALICMMPHGPRKPEYEANARRIVACVNACEEISTEALETGCLSIKMYKQLKEQRDELLVNIKTALALACIDQDDEKLALAALVDIRRELCAAIAKVQP